MNRYSRSPIRSLRKTLNQLVVQRKPGSAWFKDVVIPLLTTLIAIVAILSNVVVQYRSNEIQVRLKEYEVGFKPKQEAYTTFMSTVPIAYQNALYGDRSSLITNLDKMKTAYFTMEPFLGGERDVVWRQYQDYVSFCHDLALKPTTGQDAFTKKQDDTSTKYIEFERNFRDYLYYSLFRR